MLAANKHLPVWETRTVATTYNSVSRVLSAQPVSRLVLADGSLLFIVQIQYERHNTGNGTLSPKDS